MDRMTSAAFSVMASIRLTPFRCWRAPLGRFQRAARYQSITNRGLSSAGWPQRDFRFRLTEVAVANVGRDCPSRAAFATPLRIG
jgi:hypothetical protein